MITLKSFWSYIHTISAQYTIFEILVDSTKSAGYLRGRPLRVITFLFEKISQKLDFLIFHKIFDWVTWLLHLFLYHQVYQDFDYFGQTL